MAALVYPLEDTQRNYLASRARPQRPADTPPPTRTGPAAGRWWTSTLVECMFGVIEVGSEGGRVPSARLADRGASAGQRRVRADRGGLAARGRAARLPAARCAAPASGGARRAGPAPPGRVRPGRARG